MSYTIVRTKPGAPLDEIRFKKLGAEYFDVPCKTEEEIISAARYADIVVTFMQPFTRKVIRNLEKCRLIHSIGAGYEGIDIEAATDYSILVSYPGDYCKEEVAEYAMTLILACAKKVTRVDRAVRAGKWLNIEKPEIRKIRSPIFRLKGQTLGLIGLGRTGQAVVTKADGFGMKVVAYDPYLPANVFEELGVECVSMDQLLSESDFISVHSAVTSSSKAMIGIDEFRKMKPTAYLINTARAEIIDSNALVVALERGYIGGAGLDVVVNEYVPLDHPLLRFDNVILTGHSAYYSEESTQEMKQRAYEAVAKVLKDEWPEWLLNPQVKEKYLEKWNSINTGR